MPDEPEVIGLLALMLLAESRRAARTTPGGDLVLLAEQDRSLWDPALIAEGQALVRQCLRRNQPGPYQIQAAINAVHSESRTPASGRAENDDRAAFDHSESRTPASGDSASANTTATDWRQILRLYDQLLALEPSPVVALHRAVALAEVEGPDAALTAIGGLDLDRYHLFHAVRADLLRRLGRTAEAALAYQAALARTDNTAERDFLRRRHETLTQT
jgi:RNA polymerase sigma-70 factor (ECF subfamily)